MTETKSTIKVAKKFSAMPSKSYYCTHNSVASTVKSHKVPLSLLEQFQRRATRTTTGLEQLSCEDRLRACSAWRRLGGDLVLSSTWMGPIESWRETFLMACSERTRVNGFKLKGQSRYEEEVFDCEDGETLEQVAQGNCECLEVSRPGWMGF